jgi:hypothetical protein
MPRGARGGGAQTNLVIILSFLVLFNFLMMLLSTFGGLIVSAILTLVVDFGALILILIYLPRLRWR